MEWRHVSIDDPAHCANRPKTSVLKEGARVEARFGGGAAWYPGAVAKVHAGISHVDVQYDDGDLEERVPLTLVRSEAQAPRR